MKTMRDLYDAEIARMNQPHYWKDGQLRYVGDEAKNYTHKHTFTVKNFYPVTFAEEALADFSKKRAEHEWKVWMDAVVARAAAVATPASGQPVWVPIAYEAFRSTKIARQPSKSDFKIGVMSSWEGVFADNCACGALSCGAALGCQDSAKETLALSCQCGSGSNLIGPGHSDYCQCYKV